MRRPAEPHDHRRRHQLRGIGESGDRALPVLAEGGEEPGQIVGRLVEPEVDVTGEPLWPWVYHSLPAHEQVPNAMLLEQRGEDLDVGGEMVRSHLRRSDSRTSGASSPYTRRRSVSAMRRRSSSDKAATCSRSHASASAKPLAWCAMRSIVLGIFREDTAAAACEPWSAV